MKTRTMTALAAVLITLVLGGCSSAKKQENDTAAASNPQDLGGIESRELAMDAQGSDSGKIEGLQSIHFEYDSDTLTTAARKSLQGNADWMKTHGNMSLVIEGHCDERGSNEYNLALGERRANSVKRYLTSIGVNADRLRVVSYGEERPLVKGDTEEAYAQNRRANFLPNETAPVNRSAIR